MPEPRAENEPETTALPGWLDPLPDAEQQRATDTWAIETLGITSIELMEHAGTGLAGIVGARVPDGRIVVVCGKGNNGGDGLVAARLLRERGQSGDRRAQAAHPAKKKPELMASGPDQVWSWDITKLKGPARGIWYLLYVIIDIYSRKAIHWEA